MKTILFLEDDPDQSDSIVKQLQEAFPVCEIVACDTECEFLEKMTMVPEECLYFAVLDAMVPWCLPSEDMTIPPKEVQAEGIRYAGRRCLKALRERFGPDVPVWIYSILTSDRHGVVASGRTYVLEKQPQYGNLLPDVLSKIA